MEELLNFNKDIEDEFEVEEIKINLPSKGHISGKWWGDKSIRPIVCFAGWQDNAGTFDRLIPLLPREFSYLAIDLPGHGRSSWLPSKMIYHSFTYLYIIDLLLKEYKWEKISIIAHSLSSRLLFLYSAIFPDKVDIAIGFDNLKPLTLESNQEFASIRFTLDGMTIINERSQESDENPPAYTIDEMIKRIYIGSQKSVTIECAKYLLKRNIQPSRKYPGKFTFSRDNRLKYSTFPYFPHEDCLLMAKRITMPYLFITASGTPEYEKSKYTTEVIETMLMNPNFEYHMVDSNSHHFHLIEPEKIVEIVGNFIRKHRSKAHL
ncbi:hypothetical protein PVAND_002105 [Polypedilum vanderplanki]|uniref:AB hydrolase-1 domain-containing protein n=1 Tax=Polypedilum vanderplanki TaxID=319348 RepID=A0A9J6BPY3_POLVA|nr:hypothetical protein PVAND_002105 [Polypedilum vanderplanki]